MLKEEKKLNLWYKMMRMSTMIYGIEQEYTLLQK